MDALKDGLCTEKDEKVCREKHGKYLEWTCENCPKKKADEIMDYTRKMLRVWRLQRAGFPMSANDLTLEEWEDLGRMKEVLTPPQFCPFMKPKEGR